MDMPFIVNSEGSVVLLRQEAMDLYGMRYGQRVDDERLILEMIIFNSELGLKECEEKLCERN